MNTRALDLAHYVVSHSLAVNKPITHIHLQKILYFLAARYLYKYDTPLFNEAIEKWKLGPVIPEVYHEYKGFGAREITFVPTETVFKLDSFGFETVEFNPNKISPGMKQDFNPLIEHLAEYNGFNLVDRTHAHYIWYKDFDRINNGEKGLIYDEEEMKLFFKSNPHFLKELGLIP